MDLSHLGAKSTYDVLTRLRREAVADRLFFEGENADLTHGELFRLVDAFCAFFAERGLKAGDRVAIALEEDVHSIAAFVSGMWLGLEVSMIDPAAPPVESEGTLVLLDPDHLLLGPNCRQAWAFLGDGTFREKTQITIDAGVFQSLSRDAETAPRAEPCHRSFEDPLLIVLTSGTTGTPKGVVLSYRAILSQSINMGTGIDFGENDRILNLFRLYQIGSVVNGILLALLYKGTLVRPFQDFDFGKGHELLARLEANPVSHFIFVPSLLSFLFRDQRAFSASFSASEFRYFVTTAAPISDDLWRQVEALTGKPVINTFGSSEVNNVTFSARDGSDDRIGTIGRMLNAACRIAGERGEDVEDGATGELWIKSDTRMSGYLNAPDLTQKVLVGGWVNTGDLARWSGENLVYVGRSVESIISGGHTIFPNEINNLLLGHPDIADACTFGKPHPEWGELVAACIVPRAPDLTAPMVSRFLRDNLSAHKIPRKIVFVDDIPLNDRGKVRLRDVQKLVS